jgi:hypothetical protein
VSESGGEDALMFWEWLFQSRNEERFDRLERRENALAIEIALARRNLQSERDHSDTLYEILVSVRDSTEDKELQQLARTAIESHEFRRSLDIF